MSEIQTMADLQIIAVADCNGIRIMLEQSYHPSVFFLKPTSVSDNTFWMRDLPFIKVISEPEVVETESGTVRSVRLHDARFTVIPPKLFDQMRSFLDLQRIGNKWKAAGKETSAGYIRKKLQDALLPFNIPEREISSLYRQLCTACFDSDSVVEPFQPVDLRSMVYAKPAFIVDGFLCAGLTLFAAPSKTGKSFLCLDLACCVAEGKPFWGFKTQAGSVLYLALEDSPWRIQDRLVKVGRKNPTDAPKNLEVQLNANTLDNGLIRQLEMWLDSAENPRLVIVDTLELVKGRASRNESAYSADYRFMRPLHNLAISRNIAIIAVTHTRKSTGFALDDVFDNIIGSTAQMGGSDASWIISGKRGEDVKVFTATGRDFESVEFQIERGSGGRWKFKGTTEEQQAEDQRSAYDADPIVKVIRQQLAGSGGSWRVTAQDVLLEVAKDSGSYPVPDATRMSKRLKELAPMLLEYDGIIVKPPETGGRYGRFFMFEQQPFAE